MKENALTTNRAIEVASWEEATKNISDNLLLITRTAPEKSNNFFRDLIKLDIKLRIRLQKQSIKTQLAQSLVKTLPPSLKDDEFYQAWLDDMATICLNFCKLTASNEILFWLTSTRVCQKFHVDKTPCRLLVTYYGMGTQWLAESLQQLQQQGHPPRNIKSIQPWSIAVFRGGKNGVVHRSPPEESQSILMRLDLANFIIANNKRTANHQ